MKKSKLLAALVCSASMLIGSVVPSVPAMADAMKVVTLGADLSEDQKNTMLRYFKVDSSQVQIIYVTNQDERDHLSSYVPLEQIGTMMFRFFPDNVKQNPGSLSRHAVYRLL